MYEHSLASWLCDGKQYYIKNAEENTTLQITESTDADKDGQEDRQTDG